MRCQGDVEPDCLERDQILDTAPAAAGLPHPRWWRCLINLSRNPLPHKDVDCPLA